MSVASQIIKKQNLIPKFKDIYPPQEVFINTYSGNELHRTVGGHQIFITEDIILSEEYGICSKYKDVPYLYKGMPHTDSVRAISVVKATVMLLLKNIKLSKFLKKRYRYLFLLDLCKIADNALAKYSMKDEYLCPFARESKKFITLFLEELKYPTRIADIFAYFVQYDNNYRDRLQDLASESSPDRFKSPQKEIKRLLRLSIERDISNTISSKKFTLCVKLLTLALYLPKVRRAFKKALSGINFKRLQFDEADRFFCLVGKDYNYFGRTYEDRYKDYDKLTPIKPKQLIV